MELEEKTSLASKLLLLVSFLIVAFGQPAWSPLLCPLAAVCGFALFWIGASSFTGKKSFFWIALLWFTGVELVQLSWFAEPRYHGIGIVLPYTLISSAVGVQFALFSCLVCKKETVSFAKIVALASLWTLLEWSRLYFLCGFSWNPIGLSLTGFTAPLQWASVFGVYGLSFWVMLVNLIVYRYRLSFLSAGAALVPYGYGAAVLLFSSPKSNGDLEVALVQTALRPSQKVPLARLESDFIPPAQQWMRVLSLLKGSGKSHYDLILFPEAAFPWGIGEKLYRPEVVSAVFAREYGKVSLQNLPSIDSSPLTNGYLAQSLANLYGADVVIGLDQDEGDLHYNAAFHFRPFSQEVHRYEKQILVPLAEYMPFSILRALSAKYGITEFFTPGKGAALFQGKVPFAPSICYEETYSPIVHEGRRQGAKFFVNLTNDNWYPGTRLPVQHLYHGRIRAVENGIPLFRACNTGVTAIVDCFGRIQEQIGTKLSTIEETAAVLSATVELQERRTLYSLWGEAPLIGFALLSLLFFRKIELDSKPNPRIGFEKRGF